MAVTNTMYTKTKVSASIWSKASITSTPVQGSMMLCAMLCRKAGAGSCNIWRYQDNNCHMAQVYKVGQDMAFRVDKVKVGKNGINDAFSKNN